MASRFRILKVYYTPGAEGVSIAVTAADGALSGTVLDLYTTQAALQARCADQAMPWSDAEVVAEAESLLLGKGAELHPDDPARRAEEVL